MILGRLDEVFEGDLGIADDPVVRESSRGVGGDAFLACSLTMTLGSNQIAPFGGLKNPYEWARSTTN